jgi:hypothetical protein
MPIHFHSHRAIAERLVASQASKASEAAIHTVLADMHEQAAAVRLNDSLAPLEHSQLVTIQLPMAAECKLQWSCC